MICAFKIYQNIETNIKSNYNLQLKKQNSTRFYQKLSIMSYYLTQYEKMFIFCKMCCFKTVLFFYKNPYIHCILPIIYTKYCIYLFDI